MCAVRTVHGHGCHKNHHKQNKKTEDLLLIQQIKQFTWKPKVGPLKGNGFEGSRQTPT